MINAYIHGNLVRVNPGNAIGKGGEADVFTISATRAIKLFKPANHPDLFNNPKAQTDAAARLVEHQRKLPAFPKNLPPRVIVPEDLATDKSGRNIVGYTMPLVDGGKQLRFYWPTREEITAVLLDLHSTVGLIHKAGVVVGDFTALNILGKERRAFLIDADSMQFGQFITHTYTEHYVDPTHCDPLAARPLLAKPHTTQTDWYAFAVIAMECLLKVTPYHGGVYKGPVPHYSRPLKRITIFNPKVVYPKQAVHFKILPDDLLHFFQAVFEKDHREIFPTRLLAALQWQSCACGLVHARPICPDCGHQKPQAKIPPLVVTRGTMRAVKLFATAGTITHVDCQNGVLHICFVEAGRTQIRIGDASTDLGVLPAGSQIRFASGKPVVLTANTADFGAHKEMIDGYRGDPQFVGTGKGAFWPQDGRLWKLTRAGPCALAETLRHQTRLWAGDKLGLAFYQAGNISDGLLFFTDRAGVVAELDLHFGNAQLLELHAVFSGDATAWVFAVVKDQARLVIRLRVLDRGGKTVCSEEADADSPHWLCGFRGACANHNSLFVPTNEGVTRVTLKDRCLQAPSVFTQTEDFVDLNAQLFLTPRGIAVTNRHHITELQIH